MALQTSCALVPSVTLYGTTQITTTARVLSTYTSTIVGDATVTLTAGTAVSGLGCDPDTDFGGEANLCTTRLTTGTVTVTPTSTTTLVSEVDKATVITSVVPQKTLYSPCDDGTATATATATATTSATDSGGDGEGTTVSSSGGFAFPSTTGVEHGLVQPVSVSSPSQVSTSSGALHGHGAMRPVVFSSPRQTPRSSSFPSQTQTSPLSPSQERNQSSRQTQTPSHSSSPSQSQGQGQAGPSTPSSTSSPRTSSSVAHASSSGALSASTSREILGPVSTTTTALSANAATPSGKSTTVLTQLDQPSTAPLNPSATNASAGDGVNPLLHPPAGTAPISQLPQGDTSSPHSSSSHSTATIAGAVVGSIAGLLLLCLAWRCWQRRRATRREQDGSEVDYWERRFRELEAQDSAGENGTSARSAGGYGENAQMGEKDDVVDTSRSADQTRKLHLTLDLASEKLTSRPTSTLSALSSFFTSRPQPERYQGGSLNFSRPIRDGETTRGPEAAEAGESSAGETREHGTPGTGSASVQRRSLGLSTFLGAGTAGGAIAAGGGNRKSMVFPNLGKRFRGDRAGADADSARRTEWVRTIVEGDGDGDDKAGPGLPHWMGSAMDNGGYPLLSVRGPAQAQGQHQPSAASSSVGNSSANGGGNSSDTVPRLSAYAPEPSRSARAVWNEAVPYDSRNGPSRDRIDADADAAAQAPRPSSRLSLSGLSSFSQKGKSRARALSIKQGFSRVAFASGGRRVSGQETTDSFASSPASIDSDYLTRLREASHAATATTATVPRLPVPVAGVGEGAGPRQLSPRRPRLPLDGTPVGEERATHPTDTSSPTPPGPSAVSALASTSAKGKSSGKRARAPGLALSRAAVTPSLWVDDELYAQFHDDRSQSALSKLSKVDVSAFSSDIDQGLYGGRATTAASNSSITNITHSTPSPASFGAPSARTGTTDFDRSPGMSASDGDHFPGTTKVAGSAWSAASGSAERGAGPEGVTASDRSAVTPQLPVMSIESSPAWDMDSWGVRVGAGRVVSAGADKDIQERQERVVTTYRPRP